MLREIAQQARLVVGAEYAAVGIASERDPGSFGALVSSGMPDPVLLRLRGLVPRATCVLGEVVLRGKTLRVRRASDGPGTPALPPQHPPIRSLLGVPLTFEGSQVGGLVLGNKTDGDEFTSDDQHAIELLAARAAASLRAARLYDHEARTRHWLQTIIDQIPEPLVVADAQGHMLQRNCAAGELGRVGGGEHATSMAMDLRLPSGAPVPSTELPLAKALETSSPVTGIELLLQLRDGSLRPVVASAAPRVGGLRLDRMIEDLLDASRLESSRLKLDRHPVALAALLRQILARTGELAGREVRQHPHGDLPEVDADAARIEQVFSNPLTNAAKYGEPDTPIDVQVTRHDASLCVSVTNVGRELTVDELKRLFGRFYRAPSAEAGPKRGLGLGLYISKGLVEVHGGRIWAECRERRTTFHFTLPHVAVRREPRERSAMTPQPASERLEPALVARSVR